MILIHTSVKLVTVAAKNAAETAKILIHTSVKLVTTQYRRPSYWYLHFNPHEREARDALTITYDYIATLF